MPFHDKYKEKCTQTMPPVSCIGEYGEYKHAKVLYAANFYLLQHPK